MSSIPDFYVNSSWTSPNDTVIKIWHQILENLSVYDLTQLSQTSSYFNTLILNANYLWRQHYHQNSFPEEPIFAKKKLFPVAEEPVSPSKIEYDNDADLFDYNPSLSPLGRDRRSISCPDISLDYDDVKPDFQRISERESIDDLILKLTDPETPADPEDIKTFLTTYPLYMKTEKLIKRLEQRYMGHGVSIPESECFLYGLSRKSWFDQVLRPIQIQVCSFLQRLITHHYENLNKKHLFLLHLFIRGFVYSDDPQLAKSLLLPLIAGNNRFLNSARNVLSPKRHMSPFKPTASPKKLGKDTKQQSSPSVLELRTKPKPVDSLYDMSASEFAQRLTRIEFSYFRAIKPHEFVVKSSSMERKQKEETGIVACPNVNSMIARFNHMTRWISSMVLKAENKRVKTLTKFIKIAKKLRKLNNFHTMCAILLGLNDPSVIRLQDTFKKLSSKNYKIFQELTELMSAEHSYAKYRKELITVKPPCIPYIGVYLRDLTLIICQKDLASDSLINFKNQQKITQTLSLIQEYQKTEYDFELNAAAVKVNNVIPQSTPVSPTGTLRISKALSPTTSVLLDDKSLSFLSQMIEPKSKVAQIQAVEVPKKKKKSKQKTLRSLLHLSKTEDESKKGNKENKTPKLKKSFLM